MSSPSSSTGSGIGFLGLLTVVFITLKLIGKITWAWKWVLAPLWGGFLLAVLCLMIVLAIIVLGGEK